MPTEVAEYGAAKNVVVNLENDDLISEDAFFVVKVIEAANHPYLHALPDFANSMMTGDAESATGRCRQCFSTPTIFVM